VRAAAELGRPLSAFAIGPGSDFEELADCWVGAYGLATAGAVPAGWTRLAQPQQFTGKLFTSFRGRKIPRLRGRRRSFGPSRSFHGPSCEGIQRQEGRARQETIAPRIRAF